MGLFWTVGNYSRKRPPFFELVQLGSGRFAFGQLKNWVTLSFLNTHQPIQHKIIHYCCRAVSTSVASLFHLKRHTRFSLRINMKNNYKGIEG